MLVMYYLLHRCPDSVLYIHVFITLRLAGAHTCAGHQTFIQVNQADLETLS